MSSALTEAQTAAQRNLLADLQDLSLRVDEAQHELDLGVATADLWLAIGGARRVMSLGALMAEKARKYERTTKR